MNSSVTGAIAEPIMPAKVWKENTCVTRAGAMRSESSA